MIDSGAVTAYLQRLRLHFPSFRAFGSRGGEALDSSERHYKVELVLLFRQKLAMALQRLPVDLGAREQVGGNLVELFTGKLSGGKPQILVWYGYYGPLARLDASGKSEFAALTANLLYGPASLGSRVDEFVFSFKELVSPYLDERASWPAMSRSIPSFLLMLADPSVHAIVKTEEFRRAVESFTGKKLPAQPLTGGDYIELLDFLASLRDALEAEGLRPRDMIDTQTFIWVGDAEYTSDEPNARTKRPSSKELIENSARELIEDLSELEHEVPDTTEREQLAKARIGQGRFRANVIAKWGRGEVCALTGVAIPEMLIASHIKPWRESSNSERLDPMNGLLLIAHADRLFDRYLMSFKPNRGEYLCVLHPRLRLEARKIALFDGMRLSTSHLGFSDEHKVERYMSEHLRKHLDLVARNLAKL